MRRLQTRRDFSSSKGTRKLQTPSGKNVIINLFRDVLGPSEVDITAIEKYIAPSYVQHVDGVTLDYDAFIAHMQKQKQVIASMSIEFLAMAEEGDTVFTSHVVTARKKGGSVIRAKVIAHFTIKDNRVTGCDELTRLLSGSNEDRDIGSRH